MVSVGVDGCRQGWFLVRLEGERFEVGVVAELGDLIGALPEGLSPARAPPEAARVLVDIPIGLRDASPEARGCDTAARKLLGRGRSSSVSPAPLRAVLRETTHAGASGKSRALSGKGLSRQGFGIVPKIREVDDLLAMDARARGMVREAHPELCFWAFAGRRAMAHSKKTLAGYKERMAVLAEVLPGAEEMAAEALGRFRRKDVARDDIADALVLAATAATPLAGLRTVPAEPNCDSRGLPMEMVYAEPSPSA